MNMAECHTCKAFRKKVSGVTLILTVTHVKPIKGYFRDFSFIITKTAIS